MAAENSSTGSSYGLGYRHLMAVLMMIVSLPYLFVTGGYSVGVVSMTSGDNPDFEKFDWPSSGKQAILSALVWGHLLGAVPAGYLTHAMNVKFLLIIVVGTATILSSFLPTIARAGGWQAVCALAAVQGFLLAIREPGVYTIMSKWTPRSETSILLGIANTGAALTVISLPTCGLLTKGSGGWPSIYYVTSALGVAWCLLFLILGSRSPAESRFISGSEREYIENSQGDTVSKKALPTPWCKILTSPAFIVLFFGEACNGWGASIIMSELPSFVHDVLKIPIEYNGFVSALPSACIFLLMIPSSWLADNLIRRGVLSRSTAKKTYTMIGMGINGALLIVVGIFGKNVAVAMTFICLATACATLSLSGLHTTHLDLSPNYAGILMSLAGIGNSISGILAPLTVGAIVKNETAEEWTWVFLETGTVLIVGGVTYVLFGSTDLQTWNDTSVEASNNDHKRNEIYIENL